MISEWIMVEHHRLHIVEEWPDGSYKEVVLKGIRCTLDSLVRYSQAAAHQPVCTICHNRRRKIAVLDSSSASVPTAHRTLAA